MRHAILFLATLLTLLLCYSSTAGTRGFGICGEHCHLSNAGIELPNRGADLLGLGVSAPLPWEMYLHLAMGLGKGIVKNQFGAHESFERALRVGLSREIIRPLFVKVELGGMLAYGQGRNHTAWASAIIGVSVTARSGLRAFIGVGPTFLTHPDYSALSGHFQFNVQSGFCLVDSEG